MNWNGGVLSRSRNTANKSLSTAQRRHFAKARANPQTPRQFRVGLEFSALEHARREELAARKRSPPTRRVDHHADSSIVFPASLNEGMVVIPSIPSSSPAFPISSECKKDDSLEDQKRRLLAMSDWCGLKKPLPVERVATSIADVGEDIKEGKGYRRANKRRLSDSSEAYSPAGGLTSIIDSLKTRGNKRQQSESGRRIVQRSDRDGSKLESCSFHRASPFYSALERVATPCASHYLNSDENLFADEHTKSQPPLFQPSPLRCIAYDWSDMKSDAVLSAGSPLDTRSLTDSPVETEKKVANHRRHSSISGLSQVGSTIRTRLPVEVAVDAIPMSPTAQPAKKIMGEELLSPDSGWKDFVIGSEDGEISDKSSTIRQCVNSQTDLQSLNSYRKKNAASKLSNPHQFAFHYSNPSDEPFLDKQSPHQFAFFNSEPSDDPFVDQQSSKAAHEPQVIYSPLSSPHRLCSISSGQSTDAQSMAHAAISLPKVFQEIPCCPPRHLPTLRDQPTSPYDRESTEELEQQAKHFVKPTFIFTKPARFVGDRVAGVPSSTETGESRGRGNDSSLGQAQLEWKPDEDVED